LILKNSPIDVEQDIDLSQIIFSLLRNKRTLSLFALIGIIIGGIRAFVVPRTWQGEFQIVLKGPEKGNNINISDSALRSLIALTGRGQRTQLLTQVEILKSPSVLMPVFNFFKTNNSNKEKINNLRFKDWKKKLTIDLEKGTSVLNLTYKDFDKKTIIPVLNKISDIYQDYSNKKKNREINNSMDFLEKQIEEYKLKSSISFKKFQKFSSKHDLKPLTILGNQINSFPIKSEIISPIESQRIDSANNIRFLKSEKIKIENIPEDSEEIFYYAQNILSEKSLPILVQLENEFIKKKTLETKYTKSDPLIIEINNQIKVLQRALKNNIIEYLNSEISKNESIIEASTRPEEILIKFNQLNNLAERDKNTLNLLEQEYRILSLEISRSENPWELITEPTLLPYPVSPKRKVNLALGLLSGLIIGSSYAIYLDKKRNIIYDVKKIKLNNDLNLLENLEKKSNSEFSYSLKVLSEGPLAGIKGRLTLFNIGDDDQSFNKEMCKIFQKSFENNEVLFTRELLEATKSKNILILISLGVTTFDELNDYINKFSIQKNNLLGLIILPDSKNYS